MFFCFILFFFISVRYLLKKDDLKKSIYKRMYFWISAFVTLAHAASNCKSFNHEINHKKKKWTHEILTRKNFGPTKYSRKKFWTHKVHIRKNFGPTKYPREKNSDSWISTRKLRTYKKVTTKNSGPLKYPWWKFWDHEIPTNVRWHDDTKPTRPTIARDPRNLAH